MTCATSLQQDKEKQADQPPEEQKQETPEDVSVLLSLKVLAIFATCLPTLTVYACTFSAYITHADTISKLPLPDCPNDKIILAPVSYSIASWSPQKQLWMLAMMTHFPARALILIMVPRNWKQDTWRWAFYSAICVEILCLVILSLFHDDSEAHQSIHFACLAFWGMASIAGMVIVILMERAMEGKELLVYHTWLAKIAIFTAFLLGGFTIAISHTLTPIYCSVAAYTIFCLAEYVTIALNAAFWSLVVGDFCRDFKRFQIVPIEKTRRKNNKVAPEKIAPIHARINASSKEPSIILSTRVLGFLATCLPTITIFVCIVSAFFTHEDKIAQYVIAQCIGVKIIIAPVSYSIATWRPQKQLWMLALIVHLPARTLLMLMYPQQWRERGWRWGFHFGTTLEILALVLLSLFHMASEGDFYVHFVSFGLWWMATIVVMVIVVHMQRATMNVLHEQGIYRWWLLKILLMILFIVGSCTTSMSYLLSQAYCSVVAFTMFCIGEYTLITLNATFWTTVLIEFGREFQGFQILSLRRTKIKELNIASESSSSKKDEIKHTLYDVDK